MDILISCFWIPFELIAMLLFEAAFLRRRISYGKAFCVMLVFYILSVVNDTSLFYTVSPFLQKAFNITVGAISFPGHG